MSINSMHPTANASTDCGVMNQDHERYPVPNVPFKVVRQHKRVAD
jgi:hypothetical protein